MARIKCGNGDDGEPSWAHHAGSNQRDQCDMQPVLADPELHKCGPKQRKKHGAQRNSKDDQPRTAQMPRPSTHRQ